jgi:cytoskeletal protein CcmA (bactofilin family)
VSGLGSCDNRAMPIIGEGVIVRGEVSTARDLTINGQVDGPVWCEDGAVVIAATGLLNGEVFARDITVFGTVRGTLVATEVVDIRPNASVNGRVVAARFILTDGGTFNGTADPQHLETVLRVARHRRQVPPGTAAPAPEVVAQVARGSVAS